MSAVGGEQPQKAQIIFIDGVIGAGKSTIIEEIKKENNTWHFIPEPIFPELEEMYKSDDRSTRVAYQFMMLGKRMFDIRSVVRKAQPGHVYVFERGIIGDAAFAATYFMPKEEETVAFSDLYQSVAKAAMRELLESDHDIRTFWIQMPILDAIQNIRQRNRPGEETLRPEHLMKYASSYSTVVRRCLGSLRMFGLNHSIAMVMSGAGERFPGLCAASIMRRCSTGVCEYNHGDWPNIF